MTLEQCTPGAANKRERWWIKKLAPTLNIRDVALRMSCRTTAACFPNRARASLGRRFTTCPSQENCVLPPVPTSCVRSACLELSDDTSKFWFAKYIRDRSALQKMGTVVPSQSGTLRETIQTLTTALRVNASPCYQLAQLQQIKKYGSQQEAHATFHKVRHRIAQHTSIHIPYRMPLCTPNLRVADGQLVQNEKYFSCTTCNTYSTHYLSMQLSQ